MACRPARAEHSHRAGAVAYMPTKQAVKKPKKRAQKALQLEAEAESLAFAQSAGAHRPPRNSGMLAVASAGGDRGLQHPPTAHLS